GANEGPETRGASIGAGAAGASGADTKPVSDKAAAPTNLEPSRCNVVATSREMATCVICLPTMIGSINIPLDEASMKDAWTLAARLGYRLAHATPAMTSENDHRVSSPDRRATPRALRLAPAPARHWLQN